MNHFQHPHSIDTLQNRYGLRVAARLSAGAQDLSHDVQERLRVARQQAIAVRKQPAPAVQPRTASAVIGNGASAALGLGEDRLGFWGRMTSMALVVALAAGLVTINVIQDDDRAIEVAEVDAALLTDDLPPEAYADPGFLQYLRTSADKSATQR